MWPKIMWTTNFRFDKQFSYVYFYFFHPDLNWIEIFWDSEAIHLKFIYSEKATNFCNISSVDLSCVLTIKSTMEHFVAFSQYMNFMIESGTNF